MSRNRPRADEDKAVDNRNWNPGRPREPSGGSGGKPDCRVERGGEQHRVKAVRVRRIRGRARSAHQASNGPTTCPTLPTVKFNVFAEAT